jgi:YfiH family protein
LATGGFNLSYDRGTRHVVGKHRAALLKALGLEGSTLYTVRQIHGNRVHIVDSEARQRGLDGVAGVEADGLVTHLPDTALGILAADCLPIVLYALDTPLVAVVHAGRMGTFHRVAGSVLNAIKHRFGVRAARMQALLGPAIGSCCYDLDDRAAGPFQERFRDWKLFIKPSETYRDTSRPWTMSLTTANEIQLLAGGIPQAQIETVSPCTQCHCEHFYSHRAEGPTAGRGMAIVGIRSDGQQPPMS